MPDLEQLLREFPVGVWVGRPPDGRGTYANRKFAEILGVGLSEQSRIEDVPETYAVRDSRGRIFPVDQLPFSRVLATGGPVVVEGMVIHRPDGRRVQIRAFGYPLRDAAGAIESVVVAFVDTTTEAQYRDERDSVEARLALAVNHAPIVVWAADMAGIVTLSEGAGLRPLGVTSGQLVGADLFALYGDHPTIPGHLRRALGGEAFAYTSEVGAAIYDTWLSPLRDAAGLQTGIIGISHDVSDIRRLQARAVQDDRIQALGTLAASVAHEINNPLTWVLGHAGQAGRAIDALEACLREGSDAVSALAQLREHLDLIRQGAERMAGITRDLRTFSRVDEGPPTRVSCVEVVRSVLRLVGNNVRSSAGALLDLQETLAVLIPESRLVQAVLNLVTNALQAAEAVAEPDRAVEIRTYSDAGDAVIEVANSGPGIAPADRERIFEAFYTTKAIGQGTGLGLFVSRNIVRSAGGSLLVDDRPGGGARFRIRLPAAAAVPPAPSPSPVAHPDQAVAHEGRILVIDDDPLVADVLIEELRHAGYTPVRVPPGAGARDALLAGDFDLAYCDLMMAGMTGMDLAAELARSAPGVLPRVVFMTGGAFTEESQAFRDARESACVDKPFDVVAETERRLRRF